MAMTQQSVSYAALAKSRPRSEHDLGLCDNDERHVDQLAVDLVLGGAELWQLSPALIQFYEFAFQAGRRSRLPEIERANADADRYYGIAYNPQKHIPVESLAELERRRGNPVRAEQIERDNERRFEGFGRRVA